MRNVFGAAVLCAGIMSGSAVAGTMAYQAEGAEPSGGVAIEIPYEGYKGPSVFEEVKFIMERGASVSHLGALDAGLYQLTLTDFVFPTAFNDLRVAISTATDLVSMFALTPGSGQLTSQLRLDGHDSYYLSVYGSTTPGAYALYGVELAQFIASPVPLPPSIVLLLAGLVGWGVSCIRKPMAG